MEGVMIIIIVIQIFWLMWMLWLSFRVSDLEHDSGKMWIGGSQYEARKVLIAIMRHLKVRVGHQKSTVSVIKQTK